MSSQFLQTPRPHSGSGINPLIEVQAIPVVTFQAWQGEIQRATDVNELLAVVSRYLSGWTREELTQLGSEMSSPVIDGSRDLFARAVTAVRAEIHFTGDPRLYPAVREMALTLAAASNRMRHLHAMRAGPL